MAKISSGTTKNSLNGTRRKGIKLSSMNKHKRRNYKKYRGQGR